MGTLCAFYCTGMLRSVTRFLLEEKILTLGMVIDYSVSSMRSCQDLLCDRCVNVLPDYIFYYSIKKSCYKVCKLPVGSKLML